jgi:hypothetical protein
MAAANPESIVLEQSFQHDTQHNDRPANDQLSPSSASDETQLLKDSTPPVGQSRKIKCLTACTGVLYIPAMIGL